MRVSGGEDKSYVQEKTAEGRWALLINVQTRGVDHRALATVLKKCLSGVKTGIQLVVFVRRIQNQSAMS
eukprot:11648907-Alexandrium_andersonii.AAC.1